MEPARPQSNQLGLDETLDGVERVTVDDVQRVAQDFFGHGPLTGAVLGPVNGLPLSDEQLKVG